MIKVKHSGHVGDCVYSFPFCLSLNEPIHYYLHANVAAHNPPGFNHPCDTVRLTTDFAEKLIPLLKSQPWCTGASIWKGEPFDVDLDEFRKVPSANHGTLARYYFWTLGGWYDLSKQWLWAAAATGYGDKIVVTRTNRYRNNRINYAYLQNYRRQVVFLGLEAEHDAFMRENNFECAGVTASDFLQMASIIAGAKLYIANATSGMAIAEGLKVNRLFEVVRSGSNVVVMGHGANDAVDQPQWESALERLLLAETSGTDLQSKWEQLHIAKQHLRLYEAFDRLVEAELLEQSDLHDYLEWFDLPLPAGWEIAEVTMPRQGLLPYILE